jgi:hypothetical protein
MSQFSEANVTKKVRSNVPIIVPQNVHFRKIQNLSVFSCKTKFLSRMVVVVVVAVVVATEMREKKKKTKSLFFKT